MNKLGKFAAACAAVSCAFGVSAAEVARYYEYVETDGDGTTTKGVLVSLDYIPTWQSVVEVKLKDLARSTTTGLFCSRTKNGKDGPLDNFSCICPNGTYRWDYGTIDSSKTATAPTDVHTVTCRPDGLCIDGVSQVTRTPKAVSDEPKPVHKLLLFGSYNGTEGDPEPVYPPANQYPSSAHMQVYSVKIWDDNGATLKVNLRPCVDTDGKAALYDAVGKNLYYGVTYGSSKGLTVGGGEVIYDGPDVKRKVSVSSCGAGTAVVSGDGWFAEGDPVTVTATPQDGAAFHHWEGDVPAGRANDATLVFPMGAGPRNLTAVFGSIYYVSTNGVAGATGTADDPFPTLEEALTHTTDYDTVKVCEGTYEVPKSAGARMSGTYSIANGIPAYWLTNAVTVVGVSGPEKTVFDGKGKNNCFAFILDNAEARVEGVTVCRIYTNIRYEVKESPAFEVKNGTLVNCIARDMGGSTDATCLNYVGGINLRKGTLVGCRVSNVRTRDGLSLGAGINRTEGDSTCYITNCIVEGCKGKQGAGMLLQKPTKVYGCVIRNCTIETGSRGQMGPLAVNNGSVTVENCVITNNSGRSGGGVYIAASGIVRNCLIADNACTDATGGGGVRISAGTLECCTVVGNTVDASLGAKGDGVYQTKGTIRNCIIAMNGKNRLQANDSNHYKSDGTCTYTCTYPTSVTGEGNVWEDPMFADLAGHDYRLSNLSSLFDIGSNQAWMETATDLDGNVRIEHEIVNPGCYETPTPAVKPLTCSFVADVLEGGKPLAVTFTSSVKNPGDTVEYAWSFGDGGESTEANPVHVYENTGIYDVQLVVKSGERSFTSRLPGLIKVGTPIAYVSNTGSGTWPYDTPEKATNDVNEAYQWLYKDGENYGRLVFRDGTYSPTEVLRITRPKIRLECENGPGRVFLNGSKLKTAIYGVISIQEATAVVDGLIFTNCSANSGTQVSHGSALTISAGTATNCTIAKCYANTYTTSPLYMTGGTFTHGLIWGCNNGDSGAGGGGRAGFYMNGSSAKLIDTVVSNNTAWAVAGGQLAQGVVSNCTIVANVAGNSNGNAHGILQVGGGTAVNTKIVGNSYTPDPGGIVGLEGGTMRNCLVADNVANKATGGVYVSGAATLENCTIAGNEVKTEGKWSGLYVGDVKATIRNVLVAGNTGSTNEFRLGETATVTTGLFGVDPKFRNPARGDYRFRGGSPAQNAGTNQAWMDGATDLQGNPRILNKVVDIGCYEVPVTGMMLIVR